MHIHAHAPNIGVRGAHHVPLVPQRPPHLRGLCARARAHALVSARARHGARKPTQAPAASPCSARPPLVPRPADSDACNATACGCGQTRATETELAAKIVARWPSRGREALHMNPWRALRIRGRHVVAPQPRTPSRDGGGGVLAEAAAAAAAVAEEEEEEEAAADVMMNRSKVNIIIGMLDLIAASGSGGRDAPAQPAQPSAINFYFIETTHSKTLHTNPRRAPRGQGSERCPAFPRPPRAAPARPRRESRGQQSTGESVALRLLHK